VAGLSIATMMIRATEDWMEQEAERVDGPDNVVPLNDVLRRRRSPAQVSRTKTEPAVPPEDDEPPPDAA
jgi:hypothetical protein